MNKVSIQKLIQAGTFDGGAYIDVETSDGPTRLEFAAGALPHLPATAISTLGLFHRKQGTGMASIKTASVALGVSEPERVPLLEVLPERATHPFLFSVREEDLDPLIDAIRTFRSDKK